MASVTVFVDDAVRGTLPGVCARDGIATGDSLRTSREIGGGAGLGIAWLLLLAGPIGWIGLIVISLSRSGRVEALSVQLPMSGPAYRRMRAARRRRDRSVLALILGCTTALLLFAAQSTTLIQFALVAAVVVIAVSFATLIVGAVQYDREAVDVSLDASRRWVTLSNVHPQFAAACEADQASRPQRV